MPFANFDTSYQSLPERFYTRQMAAHAPAPKLIVFNETLASTLGIDAHDPEVLARVFSGNEVPEGATPMAQVYAGHQFGNFSPQLGDGRALLIGEIVILDHIHRRCYFGIWPAFPSLYKTYFGK